MFYASTLLQKGELAKVWLAAFQSRTKLDAKFVDAVNVEESAAHIEHPKVQLALRVSGQLLVGLVRIHKQKVMVLVGKASQLQAQLNLVSSSKAKKHKTVDLDEKSGTSVAAITLPSDFNDSLDIGHLNPQQLLEMLKGDLSFAAGDPLGTPRLPPRTPDPKNSESKRKRPSALVTDDPPSTPRQRVLPAKPGDTDQVRAAPDEVPMTPRPDDDNFELPPVEPPQLPSIDDAAAGTGTNPNDASAVDRSVAVSLHDGDQSMLAPPPDLPGDALDLGADAAAAAAAGADADAPLGGPSAPGLKELVPATSPVKPPQDGADGAAAAAAAGDDGTEQPSVFAASAPAGSVPSGEPGSEVELPAPVLIDEAKGKDKVGRKRKAAADADASDADADSAASDAAAEAEKKKQKAEAAKKKKQKREAERERDAADESKDAYEIPRKEYAQWLNAADDTLFVGTRTTVVQSAARASAAAAATAAAAAAIGVAAGTSAVPASLARAIALGGGSRLRSANALGLPPHLTALYTQLLASAVERDDETDWDAFDADRDQQPLDAAADDDAAAAPAPVPAAAAAASASVGDGKVDDTVERDARPSLSMSQMGDISAPLDLDLDAAIAPQPVKEPAPPTPKAAVPQTPPKPAPVAVAASPAPAAGVVPQSPRTPPPAALDDMTAGDVTMDPPQDDLAPAPAPASAAAAAAAAEPDDFEAEKDDEQPAAGAAGADDAKVVKQRETARTQKAYTLLGHLFQAKAGGDATAKPVLDFASDVLNTSKSTVPRRAAVAGAFYQLLVLQTHGIIGVQQPTPYGPIALHKTDRFATPNPVLGLHPFGAPVPTAPAAAAASAPAPAAAAAGAGAGKRSKSKSKRK